MLNTLKLEIAKLVAEQIETKPQRKTVNFTGQRTVDPEKAAYTVKNNKNTLRHLYVVYGLLRGKTVEQVEGKSKTPLSEYLIKTFTEKYKPVEEITTV